MTSSAAFCRFCEHHEGAVLLLGALVAVLARCAVAVFPYSGEATPPMYGDFEAQRHWMEITTGLPATAWYVNGSSNDLQYWGLDYPPLTAYHSWLLGSVGHRLVPECFVLEASHGHESPACRAFMRATVVVADLLVYFPGSYCAIWGFSQKGELPAARVLAVLALWFLPPLMIIDHGHFQFNGLCFGLCLAAAGCVARGHRLVASVLFTSGFLYKTIALYYAPAFFFGILALCLRPPSAPRGVLAAIGRVAVTGVVVIATAGCMFVPWLAADEPLAAALQVLNRMFPFARGLYEDKVANVWCSISVVFKLVKYVPSSKIPLVCALVTFAALLPGAAVCLRGPRVAADAPLVFAGALCVSALAFFLFAFQVHEKSVLFPCLAACVLPIALGPRRRPTGAAAVLCHFAAACLYSMYPLVVKDKLHVPYAVLTVLCLVLYESCPRPSTIIHIFLRSCTVVGVLAHAVHAVVPPPTRLPDLWTLVITGSSCAYFVFYFLSLTVLQISSWHHLATSADEQKKD